jgi:hypothetical protein
MLMQVKQIDCDSGPGGICRLKNRSCPRKLDELQIKIKSAYSNNVLRIPLSTFQVEDDDDCLLMVEYSMDNTIVVGGMFFEDFYGYFFNVYDFETDSGDVDVINHALIYKKIDSSACGFIGASDTANSGSNPFEPTAMPGWFWWFFGTFLFLYICVSGICLCWTKRAKV